jgi:class 3 adenylate cyclase
VFDVDVPEIRYAKTSDGVHIAYQIVGDGDVDLLFVPGFASNLIWNWELPSYAHLLRRLSSFARLIVVDRRGSGLSDRLSPEDLPPLEVLADDVGAVLDDVGSGRASLFGTQDGAMICALFAATHPDIVDRVILFTLDPGGDEPWEGSWGLAEREAYLAEVARGWGTREFARWHLGPRAPSAADDPNVLAWYTAWQQLAASPSTAVALFRTYFYTDVQPVLATIQVPTLLLHREGDRIDPVEESRYMQKLIPGARLVELPGDDHQWFVGDTDALTDAIQEFLTGVREARDLDRVLATVLFTDIVGSTAKAAELGDHRWQDLLNAHNERVRRQLTGHRGTEVGTAGDGFIARFDGPARAVRCAQAIGGSVRELGLEIRAGCHTGEVELVDGEMRGIAVHIGARVAALAGPGEVLVSGTVKDLVTGSGLAFEDAGEHELKGVPDRWRLYRVLN